MSDMALPFFMGTVSDLQGCGIDTEGLRKSLTGEITVTGEGEDQVVTDTHLAIVHMHGLTIEQFNAVRTKTSIDALTHEQAQVLMATAEWSNVEA